MNTATANQITSQITALVAAANDKGEPGSDQVRTDIITQVHEILSNHNLLMADGSQDKEDREDMDIAEEFPCPWRRVVANAIAQLFFCRFYSAKVPNKQKYKFVFVGLESNASAARDVTRLVIRSLYREGIKARAAAGNPPVKFETDLRNAEAAKINTLSETLRAEADADRAGAPVLLADLYKQEIEVNDKFISTILEVELGVKKGLAEQKFKTSAAAATV